MDEFTPLTLTADFLTILATYPEGFMVISEPCDLRTPHISDPTMVLACLGTQPRPLPRLHVHTLPHTSASPVWSHHCDSNALCRLHAHADQYIVPFAFAFADASIAIAPVFRKFQTVVLTSGTLSPLDMYPKVRRPPII